MPTLICVRCADFTLAVLAPPLGQHLFFCSSIGSRRIGADRALHHHLGLLVKSRCATVGTGCRFPRGIGSYKLGCRSRPSRKWTSTYVSREDSTTAGRERSALFLAAIDRFSHLVVE
jgi:hypothetical protein